MKKKNRFKFMKKQSRTISFLVSSKEYYSHIEFGNTLKAWQLVCLIFIHALNWVMSHE